MWEIVHLVPHWKCLHFVVVVALEWPKDPKSYADGSLLLVGSPLPDRWQVMAQTKRGTLVLQVEGWAAGWRPTPVKKMLVTKTQRMSFGSVRWLEATSWVGQDPAWVVVPGSEWVSECISLAFIIRMLYHVLLYTDVLSVAPSTIFSVSHNHTNNTQ